MGKLKKVFWLAIIFIFSISFADSLHSNKVTQAEEYPVIEITYNDDIGGKIFKVGSKISFNTKIKVDGKSVTDIGYKLEDSSIATISKDGVLKAVRAGETSIDIFAKDHPDDFRREWIRVVDKIITISGPSKYRAGKTYQLKASEKNVIWTLHNFFGEQANASIDSTTGKIKVRNAGLFCVSCESKDGKSVGVVYITATGPVIDEQDVKMKKINFKKDEHISSMNELIATGKLPKTVELSYTNGTKKGKVKVEVSWDEYSYWSGDFSEGEYTIEGYVTAPDNYGFYSGYDSYEGNDTIVTVDVNFTVAQTDTRKKIVSIEKVDSISLTKDKHITEYWDIVENCLKDTKLKCKLEDGSVVELPVHRIGYSGSDYINKKGTYNCRLFPSDTAGYTCDYDICADFALVVKKAQTYKEAFPSIDTISGASLVEFATSQPPMGK